MILHNSIGVTQTKHEHYSPSFKPENYSGSAEHKYYLGLQAIPHGCTCENQHLAKLQDNQPSLRGPVQPFGSIPRFFSSARPKSLSQLPRLTPSFFASVSNCSFKSCGIRIWNVGALPVPFGCLSRLMIVDIYVPIGVMFLSIGTYTTTMKPIKTTPHSASTHAGRLTKPLIGVTIMAGSQHTQTHTKFQYRFRFLALCATGSAIIHITASDEHAARAMSPAGFVMVFTARLPAEVCHA